MKEKMNITLSYSGSDVDDGTMSLEDIVPALQGLASAYGKIANYKNLTGQHNLRVTGVKKGSFEVLLVVKDVAEAAQNNIALAASLGVTGASVSGLIIKAVIKLIELTKHLKNKPYTEKIDQSSGLINFNNCDNVNLSISLDLHELYKTGTLKQDLQKIVRPLETGKIEAVVISAKTSDETVETKIDVEEKQYFEVPEVTVTQTQETWLTGMFNSLTKTTNKGFFILNDGNRVTYELRSETPEIFYPYFIYKGPVKVRCKAHMDENLKVTLLEIFEIQKLQGELFTSSLVDETAK